MNVVPYTSHVPRADRLQETAELANTIAGSDFVPQTIRDNPAQIAAAILYGDELNLPPMQSLNKLFVVNGRIGMAAETQRALILAAGHDIWVEESTVTKCVIAGRRRDSDQVSRIAWTMDDARRANLAGKPPWKMYPRQMLLARASAELARAVFPDAIGGLQAVEELEDSPEMVDNGVSAVTPAPKTSKRRRASVTAPATTPEAPPPTPTPPPPLPGEDEPQEPAPDEPEAITEPQRRKLHALFREKNINERGDRLSYVEGVIGRYAASSNDLTKDEASRLIEHVAAYDVTQPDTWPVQQPAGESPFQPPAEVQPPLADDW